MSDQNQRLVSETFLTVDFDFWFGADGPRQLREYLRRLLGRWPLTISVCEHHQNALRHLRILDSGPMRIVNVDFHSDLSLVLDGHAFDGIPHCGSWIDYALAWGARHFLWVAPHASCTGFEPRGPGRCDYDVDAFKAMGRRAEIAIARNMREPYAPDSPFHLNLCLSRNYLRGHAFAFQNLFRDFVAATRPFALDEFTCGELGLSKRAIVTLR